jgi:phosphoglycolate phosphatase-like HAD superfamily hydrolase
MDSQKRSRNAIPFAEIKAWLFDLDGTLMDTDDQAVEALAARLKFLGSRRAPGLARRLVMMSETPMNHILTVIDMLGLDALAFALSRHLAKDAGSPSFRLIAGVEAVLAHTASLGSVAVVSTRSQEDAVEFLRQHDLTHYFDLTVTRETTVRLKPHAQPVLYAADELGVTPRECAMVGDTPVDMLSARRAGAWAIGVLCGFGEEHELWRTGAHVVLPSTGDILELIKAEQTESSGSSSLPA